MPGGLGALHELLGRFFGAVNRVVPNPPGQEWSLQFTTAVMEIANNIVRYAYPAVAEPGPLELRLRAYPGRIEAWFTDRGVKYAPPAVIAPASMSDELDVFAIPEGGYGLTLVRAAVNRLDYHRTQKGVNHWRLVKRFANRD